VQGTRRIASADASASVNGLLTLTEINIRIKLLEGILAMKSKDTRFVIKRYKINCNILICSISSILLEMFLTFINF